MKIRACAPQKLHLTEKLNRSLDILTIKSKSRLDRPTRASRKAMKIQTNGILARHRDFYGAEARIKVRMPESCLCLVFLRFCSHWYDLAIVATDYPLVL